MQNVVLYLIANPFIGVGLALLVLLCAYNLFRRKPRVAMGLWLVTVVVMFYVYVQVTAENDELNAIDLAAPPDTAP
jgi:hypothetical protein